MKRRSRGQAQERSKTPRPAVGAAVEDEEPEFVYDLGPSTTQVLAEPGPLAARLARPEYVHQVTALVGGYLAMLAHQYQVLGRSLEELGSARELASRMLATLPQPSPWDDALGPFYSSAQIGDVLGGVSRQAVAERRARRTILALRTADGHWVYPTAQFDQHHEVLDGLPDLIQTLAASGVDEWTLGGWLVSPMTSLEGYSPIRWLRAGRSLAPVLTLAHDAARRFAQ